MGLTRKQIAAFHWQPAAQITDLEEKIRKKIESVSNYRQQIFDSRDEVPYATLRQKLDGAEDALSLPRQIGDAVVAAFFQGQKAQERERLRVELLRQLNIDLKELGFIAPDGAIDGAVAKLRAGLKGIAPFHWGLEFPEVFSLDAKGEQTGGFDAMIGNPPFMGGHLVWAAFGGSYRDYIKLQDRESGGKAVDLVAHFFRRCFNLTRRGGTFGLIATNTIAQGDTRSAGLKFLCRNGANIYSAVRRLRWPGDAAVVVSVVHLRKGPRGPALLDSKAVIGLNSFLFASQQEFDPLPLHSNSRLSYRGSMVYGMGFTFDDSSEAATPLSVMNMLMSQDPRNSDRIYKFIGGEDINSDPKHDSKRYIINFENFSLERAAEWPGLLEIVREKVKPERNALGGYGVADRRREYWWQVRILQQLARTWRSAAADRG